MPEHYFKIQSLDAALLEALMRIHRYKCETKNAKLNSSATVKVNHFKCYRPITTAAIGSDLRR